MNPAKLAQRYWKLGYEKGKPRLPGVSQELFQQMFNPIAEILRKYPIGDAHLFIPGIGQISNFSAGNYRQTDGVTGGEVDQTVGRVNDAAGKLGMELVANVDFSGWSVSGAWSVTNGVANCGTDGTGRVYKSVTSAVTYKLTVTHAITAGSVSFRSANGAFGPALSTTGTTTFLIVSGTGTAGLIEGYATTSAARGTISSISVREVIGTHATQNTAGFQPYLRKVGNIYSWEFDGTADYLKLDAPLFQMSDSHCVIAGASYTNTTIGTLFTQSSTAGASRCPMIFCNTSTTLLSLWRGDAGVAVNHSTTISPATPFVVTVQKVGSAVSSRKNSIQFGAGTVASLGATTIDLASIGSTQISSSLFKGNIYPLIAIKGTVSDADLLTLERWVGKMSGVTF